MAGSYGGVGIVQDCDAIDDSTGQQQRNAHSDARIGPVKMAFLRRFESGQPQANQSQSDAACNTGDITEQYKRVSKTNQDDENNGEKGTDSEQDEADDDAARPQFLLADAAPGAAVNSPRNQSTDSDVDERLVVHAARNCHIWQFNSNEFKIIQK